MRKLAPLFLSSAIVLASGSALALGDMNKNKKAPAAPTTSSPAATPSNNVGGTDSSLTAQPTSPTATGTLDSSPGKSSMKTPSRNDGSMAPGAAADTSGTNAAKVPSTQGQSGGASQ